MQSRHSFPWTYFENQLERFYHRFIFAGKFKSLDPTAFVSPYTRMDNMDRISIGANTYVSRHTLLQAVVRYGKTVHDPNLVIGNNVYIGNGCTISCCNEITIEDEVTIGDNVYIADSRHGYEDVRIGILPQPLVTGKIRIGRTAWLGYGCVVARDLEIGEHAVIGANSVVTRSVPAYTVVAGSPAKAIKKYDAETEKWVAL